MYMDVFTLNSDARKYGGTRSGTVDFVMVKRLLDV